MRLVLDQGLAREAAIRVHDQGHDCVHIGEISMHTAAAITELLERSTAGAIVVTLDPTSRRS